MTLLETYDAAVEAGKAFSDVYIEVYSLRAWSHWKGLAPTPSDPVELRRSYGRMKAAEQAYVDALIAEATV